MRLSMGCRSRWWCPATSTRRSSNTSLPRRARLGVLFLPAVWTRPGVVGCRGSRWMPMGRQPRRSRLRRWPITPDARCPAGRPCRSRDVPLPLRRKPRTKHPNRRRSRRPPGLWPSRSRSPPAPGSRSLLRGRECPNRRKAAFPRCRRMRPRRPNLPGRSLLPVAQDLDSWRVPGRRVRPRRLRALFRRHPRGRPRSLRAPRGRSPRTGRRNRVVPRRIREPQGRNHRESPRPGLPRTCRSDRSS